MGKGNISVDKSMIKTVVDGKIIIPLPKVLVENRYYPMFSICSPTHCDDCGSKFSTSPTGSENHLSPFCLLYTSDAADEEDSVDLGGRRIIKKKKKRTNK